MTHKTCVIGAVGLALVFCGVALGDPSVTLTSGQEFTVSSGATGTSGGDIQWTGSAINFLAGSKGAIAPSVTGTSGYSEITLSLVQGLAFLASSNPVPSSSLTVGSILVVETGSSVFAKFLVTANSGGSITFTWANLSNPGGNPGGGGNSPTITAVLDAGSYTEDIAQGSVFVVKGSNLSASGYTATSYPLPPSSNNVSINFTPLTGGSATQALIVYLYNQGGVNQLAGILPSTVSPGNYNVTVTNGTTSAPFAAQVVARKPGLVTPRSSISTGSPPAR